MAIITGTPLEYVLGTAALLAAMIYYYFTRNFKYWEKKGVPYAKPTFFFGNTKGQILFTISQSECTQIVYQELEGHPYGGYFESSNPVLMIRDPDLIKQILVRDFWHFPSRGLSFDPKKDPLTDHLFNVEGQPWKNLRTKLTPTFTLGKIKAMFPLMAECAERMTRKLAASVREAENAREVDVRELCARYTIDVIGACGFGLDAQALEHPNSQFRAMGRFAQIPPGTARRRLLRTVAPWLPKPRVYSEQVTDFFRDLVRSASRMRAASAPAARRTDFMQLLLQLREQGRVDGDSRDDGEGDGDGAVPEGGVANGRSGLGQAPDKEGERFELTEDQLAAQIFVFFFAGFETSSVTMTFALYEMSLNHEIQERVREEVSEVKSRHDNKITYEALNEMTYLDQVVQETLRKYPPVGNLTRVCRKACALAGGLRLEAGARVVIPAFAIHRDPRHYPRPERFEPARFAPAQRRRRHPFAFLPFGEGPRICLGSRFGPTQVKMGLAQLISNFCFDICPGTIPIVLHPMTASTSPKDIVTLNISLKSQ